MLSKYIAKCCTQAHGKYVAQCLRATLLPQTEQISTRNSPHSLSNWSSFSVIPQNGVVPSSQDTWPYPHCSPVTLHRSLCRPRMQRCA